MDPGEKELLNRTLKLAEENNKLLHKIDRRAKRAAVYGFIKLVVIIVPLVAGYLYLEPYFEAMWRDFQSIMNILPR